MNNTLQTKPKFSAMISSEKIQQLIHNTLGDPNRARRFVSAISSAVAVNPALQECDASTIITGALLGESLNLSPSPQLGQYYLVPYKKKDKQGNVVSTTAQFQMGYKGYIQLAIRSGNYKKLNVLPVKAGEYKGYNPFEEEFSFECIKDYEERQKAPTIGYYAMFEYMNGFKKVMYWTIQQMEYHANRYSQAFDIEAYKKLKNGEKLKDEWKYSSFWYKDFDAMACKTMLRQIISKWGMLSIEMQDAYVSDGAVLKDDGTKDYVDIPENDDEQEYIETPNGESDTQTETEAQEEPTQQTMATEADPLA